MRVLEVEAIVCSFVEIKDAAVFALKEVLQELVLYARSKGFNTVIAFSDERQELVPMRA